MTISAEDLELPGKIEYVNMSVETGSYDYHNHLRKVRRKISFLDHLISPI